MSIYFTDQSKYFIRADIFMYVYFMQSLDLIIAMCPHK